MGCTRNCKTPRYPEPQQRLPKLLSLRHARRSQHFEVLGQVRSSVDEEVLVPVLCHAGVSYRRNSEEPETRSLLTPFQEEDSYWAQCQNCQTVHDHPHSNIHQRSPPDEAVQIDEAVYEQP